MDGGLWLGVYVLAGLVFGGLSAQAAMRKGLPATRWFFLGLLLNAPAWAYLLMCSCTEARPGGDAATYAPLACPKCRELNHPAAARCLRCGVELAPAVRSEVR